MFTAFASIGWVLVMLASTLVIGLSSLSMWLKLSFKSAFGDGSAPDMGRMENLTKIKTNGIVKFFDTNLYGQNKVTSVFFGSEDILPDKFTIFQLWIVPILSIAAAAFLILVSIVELNRVRKAQKISKPFIKAIVYLSIIFNFILGKNLTIVSASMMLAGMLLIEAVLFDSNALNNFAEERNLISIYREERKFEKEVSKEGKLIGNTDLAISKVQTVKVTNTLDQNEKAKINDNSVLSSNEKIVVEKTFVTDPEAITDPKFKSFYERWKILKTQLDDFNREIHERLAHNLSERHRMKLQTRFNERVEKVNQIARGLNLDEQFIEQFMDLGKEVTVMENKIDTNTNITSESIVSVTEEKDVHTFVAPIANVNVPTPEPFVVPGASATINVDSEAQRRTTSFDLKSSGAINETINAFQNKSESSTDYDQTIENIYNDHTAARNEFTVPISVGVSGAPTPNGDAPIETFTMPTIVTPKGSSNLIEQQKMFVKVALERAVRMDLGMLPMATEPENYNYQELSHDLGIFVETIDASAKKMPDIPMKQFQIPTTNTTEEEVVVDFVIPTTTIAKNEHFVERQKRFVQEALANAVKMDFNMIPLADGPINATIEEMSQEIGLSVETKDLSFKPTVNSSPAPLPQAETFVLPSESNEGIIPGIDVNTASTITLVKPVVLEKIAQNAIDDMHQHAPGVSHPDSSTDIDKIEKRMEHIEKMIQSLSLSQNYPKINNDMNSEQADKLQLEFRKIEEQLLRISKSFNVTGAIGKSRFSTLLSEHKYNQKK